jgi:hypothetical protein
MINLDSGTGFTPLKLRQHVSRSRIIFNIANAA